MSNLTLFCLLTPPELQDYQENRQDRAESAHLSDEEAEAKSGQGLCLGHPITERTGTRCRPALLGHGAQRPQLTAKEPEVWSRGGCLRNPEQVKGRIQLMLLINSLTLAHLFIHSFTHPLSMYRGPSQDQCCATPWEPSGRQDTAPSFKGLIVSCGSQAGEQAMKIHPGGGSTRSCRQGTGRRWYP